MPERLYKEFGMYTEVGSRTYRRIKEAIAPLIAMNVDRRDLLHMTIVCMNYQLNLLDGQEHIDAQRNRERGILPNARPEDEPAVEIVVD